MSWPVVTRQHAFREGHPTVAVGDTCWYVPQVKLHEYGSVAVPVRLLGGGGRVRGQGQCATDGVGVELLADAPPVDGVERPAGRVLRVPDREVGPDALREHAINPAPRDAYGIRPMPPKWALDLFCSVHGYVHEAPNYLCEGEPLPPPPLPGDAVRLASPWGWAPEVQVGDIGVLGGSVGRPITRRAGISFRAIMFRDDHDVSCSGGPATIETPVEELTRTTEQVTLLAWEWRDGFARAHNGIDYQVTVPIWDWNPTG